MIPVWAWVLIGIETVGFVFCLDFLLREWWYARDRLVFKHFWFNRAWIKALVIIGAAVIPSLIWWYVVTSTALQNHFWPRFLRGSRPEIEEEQEEEDQGEGWQPTTVPLDTAQSRADQMIERASQYDPYPEGDW